MLETKKNLYKQSQTFRCVHDVHRHFKSEMSPFYVLSQKQCYPDGCVYFHWKCRLLAKKKSCFRGFSHVGKNCFNCKYFYEEKRHQYPEFIFKEDGDDNFVEQFFEFEEWINDLQSRRVLCEGTISAINPNLTLRYSGQYPRISAHGFLIRFDDGYIDNYLFEDPFYLSISAMSQNKLLLREGDNLEFEAGLLIDRGRLKFIKPGRFQFYHRGEDKPLRKNDVLVALETYTIQENQPAKCMNCAYGMLVDVENSTNGPSRATVCLQGIADYRYCTISVKTHDTNNGDSCANSGWKGKKCHHVL
jgi:hypothetical protein